MFLLFQLQCYCCKTEEELLANSKHQSFSCGKCGQETTIKSKENKSKENKSNESFNLQ